MGLKASSIPGEGLAEQEHPSGSGWIRSWEPTHKQAQEKPSRNRRGSGSSAAPEGHRDSRDVILEGPGLALWLFYPIWSSGSSSGCSCEQGNEGISPEFLLCYGDSGWGRAAPPAASEKNPTRVSQISSPRTPKPSLGHPQCHLLNPVSKTPLGRARGEPRPTAKPARENPPGDN